MSMAITVTDIPTLIGQTAMDNNINYSEIIPDKGFCKKLIVFGRTCFLNHPHKIIIWTIVKTVLIITL